MNSKNATNIRKTHDFIISSDDKFDSAKSPIKSIDWFASASIEIGQIKQLLDNQWGTKSAVSRVE